MASQESEMVRQVARDGEDLGERVRLLGQQLDKVVGLVCGGGGGGSGGGGGGGGGDGGGGDGVWW